MPGNTWPAARAAVARTIIRIIGPDSAASPLIREMSSFAGRQTGGAQDLTDTAHKPGQTSGGREPSRAATDLGAATGEDAVKTHPRQLLPDRAYRTFRETVGSQD
jgi:hypothetical protein